MLGNTQIDGAKQAISLHLVGLSNPRLIAEKCQPTPAAVHLVKTSQLFSGLLHHF